MKKQFFLIISFVLLVVASNGQRLEYAAQFAPTDSWVKPSEKPYRQDICLNGLWQFQAVALPANFKEGQDPTPSLSMFKENGWDKTPIRIPSPWNVNSFADKNGLGGDFRCFPSYPKSWENVKMGWLRKKFTVPTKWQGQRIQIHFDAVAGEAEIILNGKSVGKQFDIFFPFDVDVTDVVQFGTENELCIGIRKPSLFDKRSDYGRRTYQAGSFWGQHIAGIWQDVYVVAVPQVRISDVYVKPNLDSNILEAEITVVNNQDKTVEVSIDGGVFEWLSKSKNDPKNTPIPSSVLSNKISVSIPSKSMSIPAHTSSKVQLSALVNGALKEWSPTAPNLYGLVLKTKVNGQTIDQKYSRFGWRQIKFNGNKLMLNGKEIKLKGDSWHFMGIPQMTRRYAWAWYKAMRDANLNAVRLHAQPYPSFYLDVADEMGILVLDETAVWASDGGPKLDDPAYWQDSERHLTSLLMRDRNHPSVFGWSVSNEVMPIVRGVMRNPAGMKDNLVNYYGIWADICRKLDTTRPWISADGEDDGEGKLPTYVVHYGGFDAMNRAQKSGKAWGVGEAGNAYYGTPEQVSETNGNRAYESFLGRMEGVAASSYESLMAQYKRDAAYRSVFNMVWYGLKPLPLGLKNTTKVPTLEDGVHFTSFIEGKPGVQPERMGPYSTTLNPGYDASLPLYETWPLFDAIRDASAENPVLNPRWNKSEETVEPLSQVTKASSIQILSGVGSRLAQDLMRTGIAFDKSTSNVLADLLFIDGANPPAIDSRSTINNVIAKGGTVVVWGVSADKLSALNELLPSKLDITNRIATSLLTEKKDIVTQGLTAADLYFSELRPAEITTQGLKGPLVESSSILLKACDTDWMRWNKQAEYAKTAMVERSEREAKPEGAILISKKIGNGRLLITTLPAAPRLAKAEKAVRIILSNLGVSLGAGSDSGGPLLKGGDIARTLLCGSFPIESLQDGATKTFIDETTGELIRANASVLGKTCTLFDSEGGIFDFSKAKLIGPKSNAVAYLSFWVSSSRDLSDLLIEPNMPVVNLEVAADDGVQVWLNGKSVINNIRIGNLDGGKAKAEALKLHQGWNHFLIKVIQVGGGWQFTGRLTCNQPDFLAGLVSALEKP